MKKLIALLLAMVMVIGLIACGNTNAPAATDAPKADAPAADATDAPAADAPAADDAAPVEVKELQVWHPDIWAWAKPEANAAWEGENYTAIEQASGVRIMTEVPTGTIDELIGPMIAADELPETLVLPSGNSPYVSQLKEAGALVPISDILAEYAPEVLDLIPPENYTYWNDADGKLWGLAWGVSTEKGMKAYADIGCVPTANANIMFARKDILAAFGKEDITTLEDFEAFLYFCKENYPDVEPLMIDAWENPSLGQIGRQLMGTFGVSGILGVGDNRYYPAEDGTVKVMLNDPAYIEMLRWLNKLKRDDIISANQFTDQVQQLDEKMYGGKYGAMCNALFHTYNTTNTTMESNGLGDQNWVAIGPIDKEGVDHTFPKSVSKGGMFWVVTKNADPETVANWLKFALSEEGQRMCMMGVEGKDWTENENGSAWLAQENWDQMSADLEKYTQVYDIIAKFIPFQTEESWAKHVDTFLISMDLAAETQKRLPMERVVDYAVQGYFGLDSNIDLASDDGVILTKVNESMATTAVKLICASSEAEFDSILAAGLAELDALNVARLEEIVTAESNAQKAQLGLS